jgi:integrase
LDRRSNCWFYRWRETCENGKVVRRSRLIGSRAEYNKTQARKKVDEEFRKEIERDRQEPKINTVGQIAAEYIENRLPSRFSTRTAYLANLRNHVLPRWREVQIADVEPLAVESWLKALPLASKSKAHLKNLLRQIVNFAMLTKRLQYQMNPLRLVRVEGASKRRRQPRVLTVDQFHQLLKQINEEPFRTMVLVAMCLGLRCSELLALKWMDVDWEHLTIAVRRSIVAGREDMVKTKYSETVPLDPALAEILLTWKRKSEFNHDEDWVFASPHQAGAKPYSGWGIQMRRIRPAGVRAGLGVIGWHAFRHTYRSWLDETGAPLKAQQELMRHADITTTMNIYGAAMDDTKRAANSKIVAGALQGL